MKRTGFSLVELVTVVGLAITLCGVAIPFIERERVDARSRQCQNNLRMVGVSVQVFSSIDPKKRLCSGASDYRLDGAPDTWGWLADGINQGAFGLKTKGVFCPSSEAKGAAFLNQLYRFDPDSPEILAPGKRERDGICGSSTYLKTKIKGKSGTDYFAGTKKKTDERRELIARGFLDRSFNTNYTASWYLARTGPRFDKLPTDFVTIGDRKSNDMTGLDSTIGPMTLTWIERGPIAASRIPLLGCGAVSEESFASYGYGTERMQTFADGSRAQKSFLKIGDGLVPGLTRGPAIYNRKSNRIEHAKTPGTALKPTFKVESSFGLIDYQKTENLYLQDTRGWYAWHTGWGKRTINLLFADGSVKAVEDKNDDGLLNPGFPVVNGNEEERLKNKYTNSEIEFAPEEIYSGVFTLDPIPKASFGDN